MAPDSSNCPPGSKLIFAFSFSRPTIDDFSNTGDQPNFLINKSKTFEIDLGPSYPTGLFKSVSNIKFSYSDPIPQSELGLHPCSK